MKQAFIFIMILALVYACSNNKEETTTNTSTSIEGTWKLITGITIEKNDSIVTDYTTGKSFIKVLNNSHFAFMGHDLSKGKDSAAFYTSGGGSYELKDSAYTEHLEYCSDRGWEGNDFHFTVTLSNDTLIQKGIEKIDSLGINRINIEKYVRFK